MSVTTTRVVPHLRLLSAVVVLALVTGCGQSTPSASPPPASVTATAAPPSAAPASAVPASAVPQTGSVVIVGRIVTMDDPPIAEALLVDDGTVTAVGTRDKVLAAAADSVPVVDIGENVAYPGFIDAHAHWIGDRNYYHLETAAEAMNAALVRGWTSISEQWDDQGKLDELEALAADNALSLRVDSYLALNGVHPGEHYGDWYTDRQPGPVSDRLRVQGLKIHLDNGSGAIMLWEADDLTATIDRANALGWQISVHTVSTD